MATLTKYRRQLTFGSQVFCKTTWATNGALNVKEAKFWKLCNGFLEWNIANMLRKIKLFPAGYLILKIAYPNILWHLANIIDLAGWHLLVDLASISNLKVGNALIRSLPTKRCQSKTWMDSRCVWQKTSFFKWFSQTPITPYISPCNYHHILPYLHITRLGHNKWKLSLILRSNNNYGFIGFHALSHENETKHCEAVIT